MSAPQMTQVILPVLIVSSGQVELFNCFIWVDTHFFDHEPAYQISSSVESVRAMNTDKLILVLQAFNSSIKLFHNAFIRYNMSFGKYLGVLDSPALKDFRRIVTERFFSLFVVPIINTVRCNVPVCIC